MPTDFKNVNEITQQVMDIVKPNPNLKDVWIQGGISEVSRAKMAPSILRLQITVRKLNVLFLMIGHFYKKICLQLEAMCLSKERFMSMKLEANIGLWSQK